MISTLISIAIFALSAHVQDAPGVSVAYADLNLTSSAGIAEFDRRLDRAVDTVCPTPTSKSLADVQAVEACRAVALRQASTQREKALATARINSETLASVR